MILQQWLNNPEFLQKNQFEKRELLKRCILIDKFCIIGKMVVCFEIETIYLDKNSRFYKQGIKSCDLTIGKSYKIIYHKKGNIKISNDSNKDVWCSVNRFIYSIKYERKEKLKNISKSDDENFIDNESDKKLICVLCGQEWGIENKYTNTCENIECNGFCTWGYYPMKPESFTIDNNGFWHLKPIPKNLDEL